MNKPRRDADEDIEINVTDTICHLSTPGDPHHCALSMAIQAAFGKRKVIGAETLRTVCEIEFRTEIVRYRIYGVLQQAITKYDRTHVFTPGKYTLHKMNRAWTLPMIAARNEVYGDRRPYDERVKLAEKLHIPPPPDPKYPPKRRKAAGRRHRIIQVRRRGSPGYVPPAPRSFGKGTASREAQAPLESLSFLPERTKQ